MQRFSSEILVINFCLLLKSSTNVFFLYYQILTSNRILELIKRVLIHKCRCIYKRYKIRRLFGTRRPRSGMCFYGLVAAQPPHHHGLVGPTLKRGTFLPGYIVLNMVKTRILVESAFTARLFFLEFFFLKITIEYKITIF